MLLIVLLIVLLTTPQSHGQALNGGLVEAS